MTQIKRSFGTETVTVIHEEGGEDERRTEIEAHIQPKLGMFAVDAPVYEGDVVLVSDPRGGTERRLAAEVNVFKSPTPSMAHIEVQWGRALPPRAAPIRRLTFENLHGEVRSAAGDLFADGHFETAVHEAFKSIEVRVRRMTRIELSGAPLMGEALKMDGSLLDVAEHSGRSGQDEREGFFHLFRGAMLGVRNPGAHELVQAGDPQQALEYLGFASLLHRRLDVAESRRTP